MQKFTINLNVEISGKSILHPEVMAEYIKIDSDIFVDYELRSASLKVNSAEESEDDPGGSYDE